MSIHSDGHQSGIHNLHCFLHDIHRMQGGSLPRSWSCKGDRRAVNVMPVYYIALAGCCLARYSIILPQHPNIVHIEFPYSCLTWRQGIFPYRQTTAACSRTRGCRCCNSGATQQGGNQEKAVHPRTAARTRTRTHTLARTHVRICTLTCTHVCTHTHAHARSHQLPMTQHE